MESKFKIPVKIKQLRYAIKVPDYAHMNDSGADLYVANIKARNPLSRKFESIGKRYYTLEPFETILCQVGFSVEIPTGFELQIRPTSGNSLKTPLRIANAPGTIDSEYRGEIGVIVQNVSLQPFTVSFGDKIAQMVVNQSHQIKFELVEELSGTSRGENGFGSTGIVGDNK